MRDGIDWVEVGSGGRFEKIVSVLLSTLHPESERVDGSGGDGGRDHQLRSDHRLDVWQSKYFLRRLSESASRKRQIVESLVTAAALQPDSWTLVTPMVPTDDERAWFDGLAVDYPFQPTWRGGDWLDARLAEHPAIVRHFMSANDEYVALIRELREEQDALVDGLSAALPRIEKLAAKINDSNPFYRADFTVRDGRVVDIRLRPAYRGAEKDSPVTIRFTVLSGPADADFIERLNTALEYGERAELPDSHVRDVVITAPPGFGASYDRAHLTIEPAPQEPVNLTLRLVIQHPNGQQLAALPARLTARRAGTRGVTLHGNDLTGVISTRLRVDPHQGRFSLEISSDWSRPQLPGAVLPIARFLQHAIPPNTMLLSIGDIATTQPAQVPPAISVSPATVEAIQDLERLQTAAGDPFPVPRELTVEEVHELRLAVKLLDGHPVKIRTNSVTFDTTNPERFINEARRGMNPRLSITPPTPYVVRISGHEVSLGSYTIHVNRPKILQSPQENTDGTVHLVISATEGHDMEIQLNDISASI
ncbi:hypothetical protein [Lentzea kentuckyensis]|uniref:hypothetical protein n=1 Tax=Lentzea kentuckyensis TaxID=360086 RepID=UPI000A3C799A|nr:hypothetical protein [Lentzea kentuckyensis]